MAAPVAVVTGAGRGIGKAIALALAARGHDVVLLGRTAGDLEHVAELVGTLGRRTLSLVCDVAVAPDVQAAQERTVNELGVPQVVVNNAGVVVRKPLTETSEDDWDQVLDVNLKGTFLVTRAFLPGMLAQRSGRVVNIASISATLGTPRLTAYCASKWGVVGFTKALAEELRDTGLCAMAILPGSVDTPMLQGSGFAPAMQPEDVARVATFAALDAPSALNGSALEVFG